MEHATELHRYARQIATKLRKGKPPPISEKLIAYLDAHLNHVFDSLEGFAQHCEDESDEGNAVAGAYLILLGLQLEYIRYRVDRNYAWARDLVEDFQQEVVGLTRDGKLSGAALSAVAAELSDAKLDPNAELLAAQRELLHDEAPPLVAPGDIVVLFEQLAEEVGDDVFSLTDALVQANQAMPAELVSLLVGEMAKSSVPTLREAAALTVLDQRREVRLGAALVLVQCAETLPPSALRRLIVVRNWLPAAERPQVDRIVRAARSRGVDCAPWPTGGAVEIRSSAMDGAGAQGFMIVSRDRRRFRLSSVLLKRSFGIIDAWLGEPMTKRELTQMFEQAKATAGVAQVSRGYLDRMVCHYLHHGEERGKIPPIKLLQVAETIAATEWRPAALDWAVVIDSLIEQVPAPLRHDDGMKNVLKSSAEWGGSVEISESWFEDEQEVLTLLRGMRTRSKKKLIERVLTEVFDPRKEKWAEHFAWTALWLKETDHEGLLWPQFAILAQALTRGAPVNEIPLMAEIALRTLRNFRFA